MRLTSPALRLAFAVGLAGACLTACVARPAVGPPRAAVPLPAALAAYYDVPGAVPSAREDLVQRTRSYDVYEIELPPRVRDGAAAEAREPIRMRWYRPKPEGGPRPAVVVSPILGSDTLFVASSAERFAHEGWHALIVRRPEIAYDETRPLSQVEDRLWAAVARQRQALDWLETRPDVDLTRIASFGVSAGGIQNAMVAGVDDRYVAHVLALTGGPLADVFADTTEDDLRRLFDRGMRQQGLDREQLRERLREVIRTDPLRLAPYVPRDKVLLVLARRDESVPIRRGMALYEALGRPQTVFLPMGHYGSILALPFVQSRAVEFLRGRLEG